MLIDETQLRGNTEKTSKSLAPSDLIQQLSMWEQKCKRSSQRCDVLFVKKSMGSNQRKLCAQQVNKQVQNFNKFLEVYLQLDEKHQRPYKNMAKRFKEKVDEHSSLLLKVNLNKHEEFIDSKRQIWEEEFQSESSARYIMRGIVGVIGALLIHTIFGAIFRWAMVNAYITSYYKLTNDPYIQTAQDGLGAPVSMLAAGITMKPCLKVCKWFEEKSQIGKIIFLLIILIFVSLSIVCASFMPSFLYFLLFHNFSYGFFVGCLFLTSLSQCQKYFPNQKLVVTSIILTGGGFGCAFFGLHNIWCVNPHELSPNNSGFYTGAYDYVSYSLPYCIRQMGLLIPCIGFIGCALMIPITRFNNDEQVIEYRIKTRKIIENQCLEESQALKSRIFYIIGLIIILGSSGNFFMTMNYKNIPQKFIHNQEFLALVVLSGMVANGICRFLWGALEQKVGFKWAFLVAMVLNIVSFFSIPFSVSYYNLYLIAYTIAGIVGGGLMVLMTTLSLLVFGEVGNQMFGYMWGAFTLANFIQYLMGAVLSKYIPYSQLILIFGATCVLALIISSVTKYQGRWQNSLQKLQY